MRVILEVTTGPHQGQRFVLDRPTEYVFGRSRTAVCALPDDSALSREHFAISIEPPRCRIRDLQSTNRTFLNAHPIEDAWLFEGDRIAAGQSVFEVSIEGARNRRPSDSSLTLMPPTPGIGPNPAHDTVDAPTLPSLTIVCLACGQPAPPTVGIAGAADSEAPGAIEWLCPDCRVESGLMPQYVPHYQTLRELGRGAMGVVYLAQNVLSGQRVALKLIAPETAATQSAIKRFLRETSVLSQLEHPNIVKLHEHGQARGRFWFAMEYVEGANLEHLARHDPGRYPINQACRMACHVLKGLEHAHSLGFVHRDIKPENILIGRGPNGLIAKISDFGLAKSFHTIGLSGLTFSGEMRGTIPFMPPEQVIDFKNVLPAGDLYATAATLYHLITGQYIYDLDRDDPIQMIESDPVPIRQRRPDVPSGLAAIIERCLRRDPAERFPDAASLRRALRPFT
ncbi:MAG: hypothetical protein KatS3mg108_3759 [Isosphaeraceae bacterium]|jgi:serine/threonine-protein kinase|nr:MAG: hypothetical protein KatS3mg108_3759 [Isosphaeraceae bacterium]